MSKPKYRLGLDVGTNSIGWAAVLLDDGGEPCGVLDMGVRIFSDGRDEQSKESNAVDRRLARGQRRRRDRYLKRRGDLMDALVEFGLMPSDATERKALQDWNPYTLRLRALDERLGPYELGRALFHLGQRRGFKSNRKAQGEESEESAMREAIGELRRQMKESGARTLGEFLVHRHENGETLRARAGVGLYPERAMYESEFDWIRESQQTHHGLNDEQWESLKDIIFFQRPLKPVDPGLCLLEVGEERAPKALPIFQEFRMLQEVNNLKIRVGTEPERPLNDGERERALKRLRSGRDVSLAKPTKDLGLPPDAIFNLAAGGRKAIKGDETAARLIKRNKSKAGPARTLFDKSWLEMPLQERNEIVKFLLDAEEPEAVIKKSVDEWGMDEEQARILANVPLPSGYGNLSEKAMGKLLPHLAKGLIYSDAVEAAGYDSHSDFRNERAHDKLPYYGVVLTRDVVGAKRDKDPKVDGNVARYGRIANPTVHIGLGQLRRVVNGLIDTYGKPERIVVELTRDLKMNRQDKANLQRQQREGRERNVRFTEMLESMEEEVTADKLRRLRLWEEQGPPQTRICPYTGKQISFSMAVSNQTEIDHILPFSRTLDNAPSNMVVCMAAANRDKGDRSPYEAFGHNPDGYDYEAILANAAKLPPNKRWRFDVDAMERYEGERNFLDRQLNETGYLSRTARRYLAYLYDEKNEGQVRVYAIPGRMTAILRRGWGLEGMLRVTPEGEIVRKQRDDHRHHAVDAFVAANTTQGLLQRFARASASSSDEAEAKLDAIAGEIVPWQGFHRNELKPFLDKLVVFHRPDHGTRGVKGKTTGQLHKDTAYGILELREDGASKVVIRKNLRVIKRRKDLEAVRGQALREALLALWDEVEMEGGKAVEFVERAATEGVKVGSAVQKVRRVRVVSEERIIPIRNADGKPYKGYIPGGNEFADVWRMRDGSWQMSVVPRFHANQPDFDIEKFRPKTKKGNHKGMPDPAAKRLMRLHIDDMGALGEGPERRIVRVRQVDAGNNRVIMDDHNEANVPNRIKEARANRKKTGLKTGITEETFSATKLQRLGFRLIKVDAIGRVSDPGPFKA